jgi:hypothetical protein
MSCKRWALFDHIAGVTVDEHWLAPTWNADEPGFTTLPTWVEARAHGHGDLILQMDIEGAEYPVLLSTDERLLRRFRIVVVELHNLQAAVESFARANVFIPFLSHLQQHFDVVHAHPNNCCGTFQVHGVDIPTTIELTLHRKDRRLGSPTPLSVLPHPLDRDNVPGCEHLDLDPRLTPSRPSEARQAS